jgi:hypothetical protein
MGAAYFHVDVGSFGMCYFDALNSDPASEAGKSCLSLQEDVGRLSHSLVRSSYVFASLLKRHARTSFHHCLFFFIGRLHEPML